MRSKLKAAGLAIVAGAGIVTGLVGGMVLFGGWTPYSSEYATGLKFAQADDAGCGIELPTQLGRDAGLTVFYCEHGNGLAVVPEFLYTTYYGE